MDEANSLDGERQHLLNLGTPPHVIDILFTEREARIAAETAHEDAKTTLNDAQKQISKERYCRAIKYSCRSDCLIGMKLMYG